MNEAQILEKLTKIFRDVFDDDQIVLHRNTTSADIEEWDSLNQIKIILAAEEVFSTPLNARKINNFENVGEMVDYLRECAAG